MWARRGSGKGKSDSKGTAADKGVCRLYPASYRRIRYSIIANCQGIKRIAENPTQDEIYEEVNEMATDFYRKGFGSKIEWVKAIISLKRPNERSAQ